MVIAKVLDGFVDDSFMNEGIIPHSCPKCLQIFKRIVNPEFTISPKKLVISDIQKIGIVLFLKISKYSVYRTSIQTWCSSRFNLPVIIILNRKKFIQYGSSEYCRSDGKYTHTDHALWEKTNLVPRTVAPAINCGQVRFWYHHRKA